MKNELKGFENRETDWLAREMRREAKLSAWNVDEAKIIKEEHEKIHSAERLQRKIHTSDRISYKTGSQNKAASLAVLIYICFVILFIAITFLIIFAN